MKGERFITSEKRPLNIRQVYLYLVSFATLMMLIVGTVRLITGFVDLVYPDPAAYPPVSEIKSRAIEMQAKDPGVRAEDIEKQYMEEAERQAAIQRHYRIKQFINSLALVAVSLPFYLYHWRKIRYEREESPP